MAIYGLNLLCYFDQLSMKNTLRTVFFSIVIFIMFVLANSSRLAALIDIEVKLHCINCLIVDGDITWAQQPQKRPRHVSNYYSNYQQDYLEFDLKKVWKIFVHSHGHWRTTLKAWGQ